MGPIVQRLPRIFRTRRRFSGLIGTVAFFGYGGWYLVQGRGIVLSLVAGVTSGFVAFLFFWFVFSRAGTGFDD